MYEVVPSVLSYLAARTVHWVCSRGEMEISFSLGEIISVLARHKRAVLRLIYLPLGNILRSIFLKKNYIELLGIVTFASSLNTRY